MSNIFASKTLRDEMMAAMSRPFNSGKAEAIVHQKHAERAQTRIGFPIAAEDLRRVTESVRRPIFQ